MKKPLILLLLSTVLFFSNTGATLPGTGASDNTVGGITAWFNPGNITADDGSATTYSSASNGDTLSQYLKATNFGFSVSGTIDGIVVDISRRRTNAGGTYRDKVVKLVIGGTVTGNNKADTSTQYPTSLTVASYGSSSDLWGTTPTFSDINSSNFGVVLQVEDNTDAELGVAGVDYIKITVYYTSGPNQFQKQSGFFMGNMAFISPHLYPIRN